MVCKGGAQTRGKHAMESKIIVMIVQLAMPNGDAGLQVRPMENAQACYSAAEIEASDPFVADVQCSELVGGVLQPGYNPRLQKRKPGTTTNFKSTG